MKLFFIFICMVEISLASEVTNYFTLDPYLSVSKNTHYSNPFRLMNQDLYKEILTLNLSDKLIPIYFDINLTEVVDKDLLVSLLRQKLGQSLSYFLKTRNNSEQDYSFSWLLAPTFDYYNQRLDLAIVFYLDEKPSWLFAKTIKFLNKGFVSLEIDQPYQQNLLNFSKNLAKEIKLVDLEISLDKAKSHYLNPNQLLKLLILPKSNQPINYDEKQNSPIIKNSRLIGGLILLTSIAFFLLAPKTK